jgi:hypothetical protein
VLAVGELGQSSIPQHPSLYSTDSYCASSSSKGKAFWTPWKTLQRFTENDSRCNTIMMPQVIITPSS